MACSLGPSWVPSHTLANQSVSLILKVASGIQAHPGNWEKNSVQRFPSIQQCHESMKTKKSLVVSGAMTTNLVELQVRTPRCAERWNFSDYPDEGYSLVAPDMSLAAASNSESIIERRYAEKIMKQRLHQPAFRARVISAYETKCAICKLGHGRLLDAAHITPDSDETSSTSVTNGLSLCKIHHTAYDINIMGIDADYTVHVRDDILAEKDGPMLEHGIKEMDKGKLWVPTLLRERPDPVRLDVRFREFVQQ
jgi:hypothetical protein